jgi:hypothetical protein
MYVKLNVNKFHKPLDIALSGKVKIHHPGYRYGDKVKIPVFYYWHKYS